MKSIRFLADFFSVDGSGNSFVKYAKPIPPWFPTIRDRIALAAR